MTRDPVGDARDLVAERFPRADWAVVTGSVLTARRTAGSDLDIVVRLPDGDPAAPHRASLYHRGWPVELFVHDGATLAHYLGTELAGRRPTLHRMVATGAAVAGDPGAERAACAAVLSAGPGPAGAAAVAAQRYGLTDVVDDLVHATDPGERVAITGTAWLAAAEAALLFGGHWTGRGKWLLRELQDLDPALAADWLAAAGDPDAVAALIRRLLAPVGGPLFDGYSAVGERVDLRRPETRGA